MFRLTLVLIAKPYSQHFVQNEALWVRSSPCVQPYCRTWHHPRTILGGHWDLYFWYLHGWVALKQSFKHLTIKSLCFHKLNRSYESKEHRKSLQWKNNWKHNNKNMWESGSGNSCLQWHPTNLKACKLKKLHIFMNTRTIIQISKYATIYSLPMATLHLSIMNLTVLGDRTVDQTNPQRWCSTAAFTFLNEINFKRLYLHFIHNRLKHGFFFFLFCIKNKYD